MNAIEINNLEKSYGKKKVLKGLNMRIKKNSVYGFLGVNGAGKTTTFGIISKFLKYQKGSFSINGKMSVLPQDAKFFSGRKIKTQFQLFAKLDNIDNIDKEIQLSLDKVNLKKEINNKPERLSHGMRKRLQIAQALIGQPEIILLDEPLSGLDPKNAFEIKNLMRELSKNKTLVISSHVLSDIEEICDHIGIIHDGKIQFEGLVSELKNSHCNINIRVNKEFKLNILDPIKGVIKKSIINNNLSIEFDQKIISIESLNKNVFQILNTNNIGILEIKRGESLEQGFLKLLNRLK